MGAVQFPIGDVEFRLEFVDSPGRNGWQSVLDFVFDANLGPAGPYSVEPSEPSAGRPGFLNFICEQAWRCDQCVDGAFSERTEFGDDVVVRILMDAPNSV